MRYWRGRQVKTGTTDARFFSMSSLNIRQDSLLSPRVWLTAPHTIVPISSKIASLSDPQPTNQISGQVGQVASQKIPRAAQLTSQRLDKELFFPLLTAPSNPTTTTMDLYPPLQAFPWHYFHSSPFLFPSYYSATPQNYVHWTETPDSHLFSADLPGVRKEEIRVEVEDSRYLVIRTECKDDSDDIEERERRSFMRKFRLPQMVDFDGISARFEDGVLTVTVPRMSARRTLRLDPAEMAMVDNRVARAA